MTPEKREAIEAAGFKVTTVKEFLGLTEEENRAVEANVLAQSSRPTKSCGFTIVLAVTSTTDDVKAKLSAVGCHRGKVMRIIGHVVIRFDRDTELLGDAIGSAVNDVERAGFKVVNITVDP